MFGFLTRKGVSAGLESAGVDKGTAAALGFIAGFVVAFVTCDAASILVDGAALTTDSIASLGDIAASSETDPSERLLVWV